MKVDKLWNILVCKNLSMTSKVENVGTQCVLVLFIRLENELLGLFHRGINFCIFQAMNLGEKSCSIWLHHLTLRGVLMIWYRHDFSCNPYKGRVVCMIFFSRGSRLFPGPLKVFEFFFSSRARVHEFDIGTNMLAGYLKITHPAT